MMKWDWIFFDADETLFTFDSFTGLQRMFLDYILPGDLFKITVIRRDLTESVVIQGDRKKCYSRYIEQKTSNQYKIDKIFKITKPALKPFQKSFKTG